MSRKKDQAELRQGIIQRVFHWVRIAVKKQQLGEEVFPKNANCSKITGEMCGVSRATVYRSTEGSMECAKMGRPEIEIDQFDINCLSRLIMSYYKRSPPIIPTMDKIYQEALQLPGFPDVSKSTVYNIMKKEGFVFKKRNVKMQVYQRLDIVATRHRVLRSLIEFREQGYKIFYQDETWCNAHHTRVYMDAGPRRRR